MKISEVIAELENLKAQYGDVPMVVRRYDQGHYGWEEAGEVCIGRHYFQHHEDGGSFEDVSAALTT